MLPATSGRVFNPVVFVDKAEGDPSAAGDHTCSQPPAERWLRAGSGGAGDSFVASAAPSRRQREARHARCPAHTHATRRNGRRVREDSLRHTHGHRVSTLRTDTRLDREQPSGLRAPGSVEPPRWRPVNRFLVEFLQEHKPVTRRQSPFPPRALMGPAGPVSLPGASI